MTLVLIFPIYDAEVKSMQVYKCLEIIKTVIGISVRNRSEKSESINL